MTSRNAASIEGFLTKRPRLDIKIGSSDGDSTGSGKENSAESDEIKLKSVVLTTASQQDTDQNALEKVPSTFVELGVGCFTDSEWCFRLKKEFESQYMQNLLSKLDLDLKKGLTVYPPIPLVFNAFSLTPFLSVRVVIIGQDPYHNPGEAHGLSFSVPMGIRAPPSLKNIYKELAKEFPDFAIPTHGHLVKWAEQGVLMLNATLTVIKNKPNSHSEYGWQRFTDNVIRRISQDLTGVVFLLWGNFAQKKASFVDHKKHAVIKTAHPSPLSYRKFQDCKCFTKANEALIKFGKDPIDWTNL